MSIVRGLGLGKRGRRFQHHISKAVVEALESRILLSFVVTNANGDDSAGSLRYELGLAVGAANANHAAEMVTFQSSVTGTIDLETYGALSINNTSGSVTIQGPGDTILSVSADGHSSVFSVTSSATATIEYLGITGGATTEGAGIFNKGHLTITDCVITGNSASDDGGGIFNYGTLALTHYTFISENDATDYGGAICNKGSGNVTIASSTISGNSGGAGGGIYTGAVLSVTNSTISDNSASSGGGGVYIYGTGTANISSDSIISGNSTTNGSGGGIRNHGGELTITASTITGNSATESSGGGIENEGILAATTCYFHDNSATFDGGGIANQGSYADTISGCTISGNSSQGRGGGIYNNDSVVALHVTNTVLSGNSAQTGGAIYNEGSFTVQNSTISNNIAHGNGGGLANGVYDSTADLNIDECTISGNSSSGTGGGGGIISGGEDSSPDLVVANSTITGNRCTGGGDKGGGIDVYNGSANITYSTITSNVCVVGDGDGGGIANWYGNVTVGECTISGNQGGFGGGIAGYGGTLTVTASTLAANDAQKGGGAAFSGGGSNVITNSTLSGNTASGRGGGIYNYCNLNLVDCTVSGNSAVHGGGIEDHYGSTALYGTIVAENTSDDLEGGNFSGLYSLIGDGSGAISGSHNLTGEPSLSALGYYGGPTETIVPLPMTGGNPAIGNGDPSAGLSTDQRGFARDATTGYDIGAFQSQPSPIVVNTLGDALPVGLDQISLRDAINLADALGGDQTIAFSASLTAGGPASIDLNGSALELDDTTGILTINGPGQTLLTINGEHNSGDLDVAANSTVTISGLTITGGYKESGDGGGIYAANASLTISECTISGNSAPSGHGGGIYTYATILNVANSTITGNVASYGGGVSAQCSHYIYTVTTTITNSTISGNSAIGGFGGFGGGINLNYAVSTIADCTITQNSSGIGGGIFAQYGIAYVTESTIADNTSSTSGGAVGGSHTTISISSSTISGNSSQVGGGIQSYDGEVNATNSTIANNTATLQGGGLYLNDIDGNVTDCTISGNSAPLSAGGGIYGNSDSLQLYGTIVAGNTGGDLSGTFTGTYNLIGDGSGGLSTSPSSHNILPSTGSPPINPLLAPLGNYGGPTKTMALLPGSPVLDAGSTFDGPDDNPITVDQRGTTRPEASAPDIGAFESKGFIVNVVSGNNQSTVVNSPFSNDLKVNVTSNDTGLTASDLAGGMVTFTAPSSGASATLGTDHSTTEAVVLDSSGDAMVSATANAIGGDYQVEASADPNAPAAGSASTPTDFSLTNTSGAVPIISDITATATTTGQIYLRWTNLIFNEAYSYTVYREAPGGSYAEIGSGTSVVTSPVTHATVYEDTSSLDPGASYNYEVTATLTGDAPTTLTVQATTAQQSGYETTPVESPISIPIYAESGQQSPSVSSVTLNPGHYELVATGTANIEDSGNSLYADAEYSFAPTGAADPAANSSYFVGQGQGWTVYGLGYANYGIGVNDSTVDANKSPYWGPYSSSHQYTIDIDVTQAETLSLDFHDDYYHDNDNSTDTLEVTIYAALPVVKAYDLTATAVPSSNGISSDAVELQWAYVPPTSGSATMEVLRADPTSPTVFYEIGTVNVSSSSSGNPIASFLDNSESLVPPSSNTQYNYEIQVVGGDPGSGSNVATATTAANEPYSTIAADTVEVPIDGSSVSSHIVLQTGVHYMLEASGTTLLSGGIPADAEYVYPDNVPDSNGAGPNYEQYGIGIDDASTNETKYADWGWDGYSTNHTYFIDLVGQGQTISFNYHSDLAPDATAQDLEVQIFPEVPFAPILTTASADPTLPQIDLTWSGTHDDESGFIVERSMDDVTFSPITGTLSSSTVSYNDTTAASGIPYYYEVVATGLGGNSGPSNVISASFNISSYATGSISGQAFNSVSSTDPPVGAGRQPITGSVALTPVDLPSFGTGPTNSVVAYAPDNSVLTLSDGGTQIYEISQQGVVTLFANLGTFPTDIPPGTTASHYQLAVAQPGNPAGFPAGDVFYLNGLTGQIIRLTNHGQDAVTPDPLWTGPTDMLHPRYNLTPLDSLAPGQPVPAWITLPTDYVAQGADFLDNSGAFGGDLIIPTSSDDTTKPNTAYQIFLVDPNGNYTQLDYLLPNSGSISGVHDSPAVVVLPDDTQRWGSYAGTILVFPQTSLNPSSSTYSVYDLSLTDSPSESGADDTAPHLTEQSFQLAAGAGDPEFGQSPEASIIPTNANFFALSSEGLFEAPYDGSSTTNFGGIAGDILLVQETSDAYHFADIWLDTSNPNAPVLTAATINYVNSSTDGESIGSVFDAGFGPSIQLNNGTTIPTQTLTTPVAGREIYLDTDGNGQWDPGEPITVTDSNGDYTFNNLAPGTYNVGEILPAGLKQINPAQPTYTNVAVVAAQDTSGIDFGSVAGINDYPPVITSTPVTTATVGTLWTYKISVSDPNPGDILTYDLPEHPDGMYIDYSSGQPVLTWQVPSDPSQYGQVLLRVTSENGASAIQPITISLTTATYVQGLTAYTDGTSSNGDQDIVELSWDAYQDPVDAGATPVYYLERSTNPDFTGETDTMGPDWIPITSEFGFSTVTENGQVFTVDRFLNTYSDGNSQFAPGSTIYYRVVAAFGPNNYNSSNPVQLVPQTSSVIYSSALPPGDLPPVSATIPAPTSTPVAPSGLTATANSTTGSIQLEWYANATFYSPTNAFEILRSTNPDMSSPVEVLGPTLSSSSQFGTHSDRTPDQTYTSSWTDSTASVGTTYYYEVFAETVSSGIATATSGPSNTANAVIIGPNAPQGLTAGWSWNNSNYTQITLNASATGSGITYYWTLGSSPAGAAPTVLPGTTPLSTLTPTPGQSISLQLYSADTLNPDNSVTSYTFYVYATNSNGPCAPIELTVNIPQVASNIPTITPATVKLAPGATTLFSDVVTDQFGDVIPSSLLTLNWSLSSSSIVSSNADGSITSAGLYTEIGGSNQVWAVATNQAVAATSNSPGVPLTTIYSSASASVTPLATYLPAPATLTAMATAETQIQLTWATVAHASSYLLTRQNPDGTVTTISVPLPSGPQPLTMTYDDPAELAGALSPDSAYTYTVQAVDDSAGDYSGGYAYGLSPASPAASATTWQVPTAPTGLTATTVNNSEIELTWQASSDPNVVGYQILYAIGEVNGNATAEPVSPFYPLTPPGSVVVDPFYYVQNLEPDTIDYYEVVAMTRPDLDEGSIPSNYVQGSVPGLNQPVNPIPDGPAALTAEFAGDPGSGIGQVDLEWTPVEGATSYSVYRATTPGDVLFNVVTNASGLIATTTNPYFIDSVNYITDDATNYYYRVTATVNGPNGPETTYPSEEADANLTSVAAPTNFETLQATSVAADHVSLSWTYPDPTLSPGAAPDEYGFDVYSRVHDTSTWTLLATLDPTQTTFTDYTVDAGTTYDYEVTAFNYSAPGVQQTASDTLLNVAVPGLGSNPPTPPGAPALISPQEPYDVSIEWAAGQNPPSGYTLEYLIYRESSSSGPWTLLDPGGQTGTTFTDSSALPSSSTANPQTYIYEARGFYSNGTSTYVSAASGTLTITMPLANTPQVSISTNDIPGSGSSVPGTIPPTLSSITEIDGVATDGGAGLSQWTLYLVPTSNTNLANITVATGSNSIGAYNGPASFITNLNPSLYPAGTYELLLSANFKENGGETITSSEVITITIPTHAQIGNFTLPVTDMTVNVPGQAPIVISRTYDSSKASEAESLGYGWQLDLSGAQVQTTATGNAFQFGDLIYITLPDGEQHVFQFIPAPDNYETTGDPNPLDYYNVEFGNYAPSFVCVDGSGAKLTVGGENDFDLSYVDGQFINQTTGDPFDPLTSGTYTVTTTDGTVYTFAASMSNPGTLENSVDANGNETNYNLDGGTVIQRGGVSVHINYERIDAAGNSIDVIGSITAGNQTVNYFYDADGNLEYVQQPQTPAGNYTFTYVYNDPADHYLSSVKNGLNNTVITIGYDPATNLFDEVIAGGGADTSTIATGAQTDQTDQVLTAPNNNSTQDIYDSEGDVIEQIQTITDSSNNITGYLVTWHAFDYSFANIESAVEDGFSGENFLAGETDYVPYMVSGTDPAGQRYKQPAELQISQQTEYYQTTDDANPADFGLVKSVSVLGASGALETTTYSNPTGAPEYIDGNPVYVEDPQGNITHNFYDAGGNLLETQVHDSKGDLLSDSIYTYTTTSDFNNYGVPAGLLISESSLGPTGQMVQQSYNSYYGNDVAASSPSYVAAIPSGSFDVAGELAGTTDVSGVTHSYNYDADGNQISDSYVWHDPSAPNDPSQDEIVTTTTVYDAAGRVISTTTGTVTTLNNATLVSGVTTSTDYNAAGQVESTTDEYGQVTQYVYDADGNLIQTLYPDNTSTETIYDSEGRAILTTDRHVVGDSGNATLTVYNSLGQVAETQRVADVAATVGAVSGMTGVDQVTAVSGAGLTSTETGGIYVWAVNPTFTGWFSQTSTTYNPDGTVASTTDADGLTTDYTYYPNGQQESVTQVSVPVYGATGGVENLTTTYQYNSMGQQSDVTDPLGNTTSYEYDPLGRLISTGYAPAVSVGSTSLVSTTTSETYDPAGNKITETDQLGRVTQYKYDDAGDLIEVDQPEVLNPATNTMTPPTTSYVYDQYGDELMQIDANEQAAYQAWISAGNTPESFAGPATRYTYNALGQETSETLPDGEQETTQYDQFGRVSYSVDFDGNVTAYTYDDSATGDGRVTGEYFFLPGVVFESNSGAVITTNASESTTYTYTLLGQQESVTDSSPTGAYTADGATTYTYDASGNVIEENTPEGIINYYYNALNQQTDMWTGNVTYANRDTAETWTQYGYDSLGRLTTVTQSRLNDQTVNLVTTYAYDANGNKAYEMDPNGDITTYVNDAQNRLTGELVKNGSTTLYSVTYTLNADGTRHTATETEAQPSGPAATINTTWGYDALDRLTSESVSSSLTNQSFSDSYTYDLDGNRLTDAHTGPGVSANGTTTYIYNSDNELTSSTEGGTTTSYGYDNNGSQISVTVGANTTQSDTYDVRNRLQQVVDSSGTTTYVYDDAGNRVQEATSGTTTYYLVDDRNPAGYSKPIEARVGSLTGNPTTTYILGDRVLAQVNSSGTMSYLIVDGLANTRALVNGSGSVTAVFNYDPFGDIVGATYTLSNPPATYILFQQAMFDPASGLNIFGDGVREVEPGEDNFIEIDSPLYSTQYEPLTLNLRLLDDADTINNIDLTGHDTEFYTSTNGITAHILFSAYVTSLGFTPHLIGPDATKGNNFYELKPITHLGNGQLQQLDNIQMSIYDVVWGEMGYKRGDATDIVPGGEPTPIGYILGDDGTVFLMTLYMQNNPMEPSGLNGQGFILYSLQPEPPPPALKVPDEVPVPTERPYLVIPPNQRFNLPIATTYDYQTIEQLVGVTGLAGLAVGLGYYGAAALGADAGISTLLAF